MLSMKFSKDFEKLKEYGRGYDMATLMELFPELNAIKNLYTIDSVQDYINNFQTLKNIGHIRPDTLMSEPILRGNSTNNTDVKTKIREIKNFKEQNSNAVVHFLEVDGTQPKRYEVQGCMNIGVQVGERVIIESCGPFFDGSVLSNGIACQECYNIPWEKLSNFDSKNRKEYLVKMVKNDEFQAQVEGRSQQLEKFGYKREEFESYKPKKYQTTPDSVFEHIAPTLNRLPNMERYLKRRGLTDFAILGNIHECKFIGVQVQTEERHKLLFKEKYKPLRSSFDRKFDISKAHKNVSKTRWIEQSLQTSRPPKYSKSKLPRTNLSNYQRDCS